MTVNKNLNRNGVPRACSILGMDFDSHTDRNNILAWKIIQ